MEDLNSVISSAVGEAKTELTQPEETTTETTETTESPEVAETPEEAPEKPKAEKAEEVEEEFFNPTAEELAAIEASPELKKVYRAMRKGFTNKTTELAKQRKEMAERLEVADWVQQHPEDAARYLASITGISLAEARKEIKEQNADTKATSQAVDDMEAKWAETIGPEAAKLLRPLIEETVLRITQKTVEPVTKQTQQLVEAAQRRGVAASVREFGASIVERGEEWTDEIQADMAKLSQVVAPAENATMVDYMHALYDGVMARRHRLSSAKTRVERLRKVREEVEPVVTTRSSATEPSKVTADMNDKDAIALAVSQAKRQLQSR